jgi:hypothetical protein
MWGLLRAIPGTAWLEMARDREIRVASERPGGLYAVTTLSLAGDLVTAVSKGFLDATPAPERAAALADHTARVRRAVGGLRLPRTALRLGGLGLWSACSLGSGWSFWDEIRRSLLWAAAWAVPSLLGLVLALALPALLRWGLGRLFRRL